MNTNVAYDPVAQKNFERTTMATRQSIESDRSPNPVSRNMRRRFPSAGKIPRATLTRTDLVSQVAEALCREWEGETSELQERDARFWNEFCQEGRVAILAYLDALEEAGYRVISTED